MESANIVMGTIGVLYSDVQCPSKNVYGQPFVVLCDMNVSKANVTEQIASSSLSLLALDCRVTCQKEVTAEQTQAVIVAAVK